MTATALGTPALVAGTTHPRTAGADAPLHPLLANRWSPRSFDPTYQLSGSQLLSLLEAARWAASANNTQPWRFMVARRGTESYGRLFSTLMPGNTVWAGDASVLVLVAAQTADEAGGVHKFAVYDTGQAVAQLVAQASAEGLAVHQMGGFDGEAAAAAFDVPASVTPLVVLAIGRLQPDRELPEPYASRERAPRTRRPLDELLLHPATLDLKVA